MAPHIFPSWTRGDDSDDEASMRTQQRRQRRRRSHKRHGTEPFEEGIMRAETHQIDAATEFNDPQPTAAPGEAPPPPPPPPPPPVTTSEADAFTSTTTTESITSTTTSEAISSTTESPSETVTIPPLDAITETPAPAQPTEEPETSSESSDGISDSESDEEGEEEDNNNDETPVEADPIISGTETSTELLPTSTAASSISAPTNTNDITSPDAIQEAAARQQHHRNVETALTVVGSVLGAIFLLVGIFFLWRVMKRRRRNQALDGAVPVTMPSRPSRRDRILARVPGLKDRMNEQAWVSITETKEKESYYQQPGMTPGFDLLGYMPDRPTSAVLGHQQTMADLDRGFGLHMRAPSNPPAYYETTPQHTQEYKLHPQQYRQSGYQHSDSGSSLSSAFGNGTHIPPTPQHPPPALQQQAAAAHVAPGPLSPKDTVVYKGNERQRRDTHMSIASSVPRFRTVNSWVRQQTGRVQDQDPPRV